MTTISSLSNSFFVLFCIHIQDIWLKKMNSKLAPPQRLYSSHSAYCIKYPNKDILLPVPVLPSDPRLGFPLACYHNNLCCKKYAKSQSWQNFSPLDNTWSLISWASSPSHSRTQPYANWKLPHLFPDLRKLFSPSHAHAHILSKLESLINLHILYYYINQTHSHRESLCPKQSVFWLNALN